MTRSMVTAATRLVLVLAAHTLLLSWLVPNASLRWPALASGLSVMLVAIAAMVALVWPALRDARTLARLAQAPLEPVGDARSEELAALYDGFAELSERVRERQTGDDAALLALQQNERLASSFLSSMGHDLRGPLNHVLGFADLLVIDREHSLRASQKPSVDIVRRAAQDLLALLEQVLLWARLQAEPPVLERSLVTGAELIADVRAELERRLAGRALTLETAALPTRPLRVDRKRLVQALLGLLDPSIRALGFHETVRGQRNAPRRTASVRLSLRTEAFGEGADASGERFVFELTDADLRIRDPDQEGFFEALRPSFAPSGRRIAGLGLGPALARALLRAHGGDVWLSSRPDIGTTLTAVLPVVKAGET